MEDTWTGKCGTAKRADVLNPIRAILEKDFKVPENPHKTVLNLTLGEPTAANGYPLPEITSKAVKDAVDSEAHNGYTHSSGALPARQAIVDKYSTPEAPFDADDVLLTFGCSGAWYTIFSTLCEAGDNVLVPKPGFPLSLPIAQNLGVDLKYYELDADNDFEIKLDTIESQIDEKTKFILVVNPSNPCGSVFTRSHMEEIIAVSEKHKIPLVCDEIYYGFSYDDDKPFLSFPHVNTTVPLITMGAISKIYGVPGWRLGWLTVHNRGGYFDDVLAKLKQISMIWLHPCSLIQAALVTILRDIPESYFDETKAKLKIASETAFTALSGIKGIKPVKAKGAMYMMVQIDHTVFEDIENDVDFCKKLLSEECCFVLPSTCFNAENMFRVVICNLPSKLEELGARVKLFCESHYKK